jgi:peptidoglycan/xylan/chitin deacetylase (PgdA/CDA1 family)
MKKLLFALLYTLGLTRFAAWWNRRRVVFLCYHGVTKRSHRSSADPKGLHVNHRRFAAQLDFLLKRYHIISLNDYLLARRDGRRLPDYSLLLTFDDGFRNFLTAAAPLLAERSIPATVFLITGNADDRGDTELGSTWTEEDDSRYLSWGEARTLKQEFQIDFGSHTCSHSSLLNLSPQEIEHELFESYRALATRLSTDLPNLSYPKGEHSQILADQARKQRYGCAVTTDRGTNELDHNLFTLGRTLIGDDDDEASFAVRVSGLRWWLTQPREFFARRPIFESARPEPSVRQSEASVRLLD